MSCRDRCVSICIPFGKQGVWCSYLLQLTLYFLFSFIQRPERPPFGHLLMAFWASHKITEILFLFMPIEASSLRSWTAAVSCCIPIPTFET
jgi:hypothetical protein